MNKSTNRSYLKKTSLYQAASVSLAVVLLGIFPLAAPTLAQAFGDAVGNSAATQPTASKAVQKTVAIQQAYPIEFNYGSSVEGRPLVGYTFGDGPNKTLIHASIHGNERNTKPLAEKLIAYLKAHPDAYEGCTVTIIPCVNPDGWAHDTRVNAHKVDLNRNFPADWKPTIAGKLNRGSAPLSEPESAGLAQVVLRLNPDKLISIHNPLHLLDHSGPKGLELAKIIAAYDHYPIPAGGVGYPTPGSLGQFETQLNISGVTLELEPVSVDEVWAQNRDALLTAIKATLK